MRGVNENQDNLPSPKVANPRYDWVLGLHCCKRFILTPEVVSVQQSGKTNKTRQDILCHCLDYLSQGTTTSHFLVTFVSGYKASSLALEQSSEVSRNMIPGPWTEVLLVRLLAPCPLFPRWAGSNPSNAMSSTTLPAPPPIAVGQSAH